MLAWLGLRAPPNTKCSAFQRLLEANVSTFPPRMQKNCSLSMFKYRLDNYIDRMKFVDTNDRNIYICKVTKV